MKIKKNAGSFPDKMNMWRCSVPVLSPQLLAGFDRRSAGHSQYAGASQITNAVAGTAYVPYPRRGSGQRDTDLGSRDRKRMGIRCKCIHYVVG